MLHGTLKLNPLPNTLLDGNGDVLVSMSTDWFDEMDVDGFQVMTRAEWNTYFASLGTEIIFPHISYVGTNEEVDFETKEGYLYHISVYPLTEVQSISIKEIIGTCYGFTPLLEKHEDEEEED